MCMSRGAALAGVSITAIDRPATGTGQTHSGTTDANGWVSFTSVLASSYDVTASLTGYNTITQSATVAGNAEDTLRITLPTATGASKVVKGTVKAGTSTLVAGAVVTLTATRQGSTTVLTLVDTTTSAGAYEITGIPAGYTVASLAVVKSGYPPKDSANIPITADTTTVNITLLQATAVMTHAHPALATAPRLLSTGEIVLPSTQSSVEISVASLDGRMLYHGKIPAGVARTSLASLAHGAVVVTFRWASRTAVDRVMIP